MIHSFRTKQLMILLCLLVLSGCAGFWENYAKRSDLTIGYSANNVGSGTKGERSYSANGTVRGSNNAIEKVFKSMTKFSMEQLGLK